MFYIIGINELKENFGNGEPSYQSGLDATSSSSKKGFSSLASHDWRCVRDRPDPSGSRVSGHNLRVSGAIKTGGPLKVRVNLSLVALAASVAVSAASLAADTVTVSQRGRKFTPDMLSIAPGTSVQIENDDRVSHHIYIDQPDMKFDSGEQSVGNQVTLRFDREGRFAVRCAIHPTMHLDVTVGTAKSP